MRGPWTGAAGLALAAATGALDLHATTAPVRLAGRTMTWLVPVLGLSLVAAALAYVVGTLGARLLGATLASFVGLTEVVFAVLFAWVLLGQLPTPVQLAGGSWSSPGSRGAADELRRAPAAAAAEAGAGRQELVTADAPPRSPRGPLPRPPRRSRRSRGGRRARSSRG